MTAQALQAGAVSRELTDWHAIQWQPINENVRRLQARIVKATQEGRWNKAKTLQHLLTHSFSGKALAVRQVTENSGKRTSGVDKVTQGFTGEEDSSYTYVETKRLQAATAPACVHPEIEWQNAPSRNTNDER